jgi:hypothetical protein
MASGYLLFHTIEDFQGSFRQRTEKIMADMPNYTPCSRSYRSARPPPVAGVSPPAQQ